MRTASVDFPDNQGNAGEGFHAASAGGTWQAAVFGFGGMFVHKDGSIGFAPTWLPPRWEELQFRVHWKGSLLNITITQEDITVQMEIGRDPLPIYLYEQKCLLQADHSVKQHTSFRKHHQDAF